MKRTVFVVSDATGITAESLGEALLSLFGGTAFEIARFPYVDDAAAAQAVARRIEAAATRDGNLPIVVMTIADPALRAVMGASACVLLDVFALLLPALERALGPTAPEGERRRHAARHQTQGARVAAMHFAIAHDDGARSGDYAEADLILTGVSRSGKTPTCVWLALQYGVRAANYPITEEDIDRGRLPAALLAHAHKLCGLVLSPARLAALREQRQPGSRYASQLHCEEETRTATALLERHHVPLIDATTLSIEETATRVMQTMGLTARAD